MRVDWVVSIMEGVVVAACRTLLGTDVEISMVMFSNGLCMAFQFFNKMGITFLKLCLTQGFKSNWARSKGKGEMNIFYRYLIQFTSVSGRKTSFT